MIDDYDQQRAICTSLRIAEWRTSERYSGCDPDYKQIIHSKTCSVFQISLERMS